MNKLGTVMIIDDEDIDQRQYLRILQRSGMTEDILQFAYADDALQWLETHRARRIDLILLDINMPRMNGFQFLDALDALDDFPNVNIIMMLTTSLAPQDQEKANAHKFVKGFLSKPLIQDHLVHAARLLSGTV
ncbi:MAG: response regulator [Aliishimia sp.]